MGLNIQCSHNYCGYTEQKLIRKGKRRVTHLMCDLSRWRSLGQWLLQQINLIIRLMSHLPDTAHTNTSGTVNKVQEDFGTERKMRASHNRENLSVIRSSICPHSFHQPFFNENSSFPVSFKLSTVFFLQMERLHQAREKTPKYCSHCGNVCMPMQHTVCLSLIFFRVGATQNNIIEVS